MGLPYRKIVRDAVLPLLAASWNDQVNAMALDYGVTPFSVDFSESSRSFALSRISEGNIETCQLTEFNPIAGCLFTGATRNEKTLFGYRFDGPVNTYIRWWLRRREGVEGFDTESILDLAEDATQDLLNNPLVQWPAGVILAQEAEADRSDVLPLGDGWAQSITISMQFKVYIV